MMAPFGDVRGVDGSSTTRTTSRRRTLAAVVIGNVVEWYDFAVFGALAVVLARVFFPGSDDQTALVLTFAVFATSFLARPLGAVLIGPRADRLGRRRTLVAMIVLMTAATAAIGMLPTSVGATAAGPLLLVGLRFVQGLSVGGETTSSVPFVIEVAPDRQRGTYAGWHLAGVAAGLASGIGVVAVLTGALPTQAVDAWAWRLPFLLAAPLGLIGLYLRLRLDEPAPFLAARSHVPDRPVRAVLRGHRAACVRGFGVVAALSGVFNVWFIYLPTYVAGRGSVTTGRALAFAVLGLLVVTAVAPVAGGWSDRTGRRAVVIVGTTALAALAVPLFVLAATGSASALALANVAVAVALGLVVAPAFVAESFPTPLRATGVAFTFGVASAVVGGTAPLVATLLAARLPDIAVPSYLVGLAALASFAAWRAPETAFADLPTHPPAAPDPVGSPTTGELPGY